MSYLQDKKILITGGKGRLAQELVPLLKAEGAEVFAPSRSEFNILYPDLFYPLLYRYTPEIIIHAAAYTDVRGAESGGRVKCITNNIIGSKNIGNIGYRTQYSDIEKLIYISTDYVYRGGRGDYKETDMVNPFCMYGFSKLAGEAFFLTDTDLIIRTSFKSRGLWSPGGLEKCFDGFTSADWIDVIAEKIVRLVKVKEAVGVWNVGTKRKNLSELAKQENPSIKVVNPDMLWKDLGYLYPIDISMDLNKYDTFFTK